MLSGIRNAAVIIGMDLRIRRYTHSAEKLLNLVPGDVGRSVSLLNAFVLGVRVEDVAMEVIEELAPAEKEVLCTDQRWYTLHVMPYKTLDHSIKGAVIVLVDIDVRKRAFDLSRDVAGYAESFLGTIRQPLMIIDRGLHVLWVNAAFHEAFPISDPASGGKLEKIGAGRWGDPALVGRLDEALAEGIPFRERAIRFALPGAGERTFLVSGSRFPTMRNEEILLLAFDEDVAAPRAPSPEEQE
jgi:two-component system CheB/CheR fusion protein